MEEMEETEKPEKQGCFAVRFVEDDELGIKAVLTGDHWRKEDLSLAKAVAGEACREAFIKHETPVYLIPERVVQCAVHHIDEPEIVTQMLLYSVNPWSSSVGVVDADMKRVMQSVLTTLGGAVVDVPWGGALTDEEVQRIFDAFGVHNGVN